MFECPFACYLFADAQIEPYFQMGANFYVGSTTASLQKRQDDRIHKYRQLVELKPVHAELMLHWAVSRQCFGSLVLVPVAKMDTTRQIRTLESTLIQKWNPPLNFPFILKKRLTKVGPDFAQSVKRMASTFRAPGTRLHRKLRKRLYRLGALSLYSTSKQHPESSWMILTVLAERSLASVDMQRALRSSAYSLQHVYALYRLAHNLDEPPRSAVHSLLTKILVFKGGVKPPRAKPMQLPMLSHSSFRSAVKKWLKSQVVSRRDFLIPFHLPPCDVVPAAHLSLGKMLINHHGKMAEFDWNVPPSCSCQEFIQEHPDLEVVTHPDDGQPHVASPLNKLSVSRRLKFWMGVSAKTQVYPSFQQYCEKSWTELSRWASRHFVSGIDKRMWICFLEAQWRLHVPGTKLPLSMTDIKYVRELTKDDFVIQGRDHAPDHLHLFCSRFYWRILRSTFGDLSVYEPSAFTPTQARAFLRHQSQKPWLKRYSWGVHPNADIPISYLLLKKKKQFLVARPIISYRGFVFARLFRAASMVINMMLQVVYPASFGFQALPEIFKNLHAFLREADEDVFLCQHNQDLVGFFTSLPVSQILEAVENLINQYASKQVLPQEQIKFTVMIHASEPRLRVFQGSFRRQRQKTGIIWLDDLLSICRLSLSTSLFAQMNRMFKQQRGSAIGNQISPSLANVAVSFLEQAWHDKHEARIRRLGNELYIIRYVDNRLVLCSEALAEQPFMQEFLSAYFYRHPVELEPVHSGEFLGTILRSGSRTLVFQQPTESFQFRPMNSAGTLAHKMSAALARICLASRNCFPKSQAEQDVQILIDAYKTYGYDPRELRRQANRFL